MKLKNLFKRFFGKEEPVNEVVAVEENNQKPVSHYRIVSETDDTIQIEVDHVVGFEDLALNLCLQTGKTVFCNRVKEITEEK